jgi:hypothetical protein
LPSPYPLPEGEGSCPGRERGIDGKEEVNTLHLLGERARVRGWLTFVFT